MHDASVLKHYPRGTVRRMPLPSAALGWRRKTGILRLRRLYPRSDEGGECLYPLPRYGSLAYPRKSRSFDSRYALAQDDAEGADTRSLRMTKEGGGAYASPLRMTQEAISHFIRCFTQTKRANAFTLRRKSLTCDNVDRRWGNLSRKQEFAIDFLSLANNCSFF